jgi:hypothetical protein
MNDEVGAEGDWPLQGRREKCVVDRQLCAGSVRVLRDRAYVHHSHERVAWGLDQHQPRTPHESASKRRGVALIHERHLELAAFAPGSEQAIGATVAVVRREHDLARPDQRQYEIDRRHPG